MRAWWTSSTAAPERRCTSRRKPRIGAISETAFSSTPCSRTSGSRTSSLGACRSTVSRSRCRSGLWSRRRTGTSMTAMSSASNSAPAAAAMPWRRCRTMWPASSAANISTGPGCTDAKRRRQGTPAATATARSSARKDFPHLGSPPMMPTAWRPQRPSTSHWRSGGRSSSSAGRRVGKPVIRLALSRPARPWPPGRASRRAPRGPGRRRRREARRP